MTELEVYEDCIALIRTPFDGEVGKSMPTVADMFSISFWQNTADLGVIRALLSREALEEIKKNEEYEVEGVIPATDEAITEMFDQSGNIDNCE